MNHSQKKHGFHNFFHVCPSWFSGMLDNRLRRRFHDPSVILKYLVTEGTRAVDIGCGPGYFSIAMAAMAGRTGRIFALDLQKKMLEKLMRGAAAAGVADRITPHLCEVNSLGIEEEVDFALAFWMVHEVPQPEQLFRQIYTILKPGGRFLFAEPKFHVLNGKFREAVDVACNAGFRVDSEPVIFLSRAVILHK